MKVTKQLAMEAAEYYNALEAGEDEDTLSISSEADAVLGKALEEGLCGFLSVEDILEVCQ